MEKHTATGVHHQNPFSHPHHPTPNHPIRSGRSQKNRNRQKPTAD